MILRKIRKTKKSFTNYKYKNYYKNIKMYIYATKRVKI